MRIKEKLENVGERDRIGDNVGEREKVVLGDIQPPTLLLPPTLLPNLSLVLRLAVPSLISYNIIPNPPYYITIIPIMVSDKDTPYLISPKAIIVLDKVIPYSIKSSPALVLIIVLDKAPALASNARYRYRTCSITASSSL